MTKKVEMPKCKEHYPKVAPDGSYLRLECHLVEQSSCGKNTGIGDAAPVQMKTYQMIERCPENSGEPFDSLSHEDK